MSTVIMIDPKDDVAVAVEAVAAGQAVLCPEPAAAGLCAREDIPIYHKIAVRDMPVGHKLLKYGEHIGEASCHIARGDHVHVHNVSSVREDLD